MTNENNADEQQTIEAADSIEVDEKLQENEEANDSAEEEGTESGEEIKGDQVDDKKKLDNNWRAKRIGKLTAVNSSLQEQVTKYQRQTEELLAKLAAVESGGDPKDVKKAQEDQLKLAQEMAIPIAEQKIAIARYNEACDLVLEKGKEEFGEAFVESVKNLGDSFAERFSRSLPLIVQAMDNPHKVIQFLGSDLDEADRILAMNPEKQIAYLAKLEIKLANSNKKEISKVTTPIKPIEGQFKEAPTIEKSKNIDDFVAMRKKHLKAAGKTRLL